MSTLLEIKSSLPFHTKIIAVSKKQPVSKIVSLFQDRQVDFAENYVQELLEKMNSDAMTAISKNGQSPLHWHFIGRLQKNKVKKIVGKVKLIHSVDSFELAMAISEASIALGTRQPILLQINIASDQAKAGFDSARVTEVLQKIVDLPGIELKGFMTMPPLTNTPEENRPHFKQLRDFRDQSQLRFPSIKELSMGTSQDYLVAAQEGSTMIRLGTVLFGARE